MLARLEGILMKRVAKQRRPLITCAWLVCIGLAGARVEAQPVKVVYVVRHAEKAAQDGDPELSPAGRIRAMALSHLLARSRIVGLFATQYRRTQQTLEPLSAAHGVPIETVEAGEVEKLIARIRATVGPGSIVVAGHSNTVPEIVGRLTGVEIEEITETHYDGLFQVRLSEDADAELIQLKYGQPTPD